MADFPEFPHDRIDLAWLWNHQCGFRSNCWVIVAVGFLMMSGFRISCSGCQIIRSAFRIRAGFWNQSAWFPNQQFWFPNHSWFPFQPFWLPIQSAHSRSSLPTFRSTADLRCGGCFHVVLLYVISIKTIRWRIDLRSLKLTSRTSAFRYLASSPTCL